MTEPFWTDARLDTLRTMRADGHSAGLIADALGCTRGAVIGKLHRLGIPSPVGPGETPIHSLRPPPRPPRPPKPAREKSSPPPPIAEVPAMPFVEPLECTGAARAVLELHANSCRWPIGEVHDPDFRFCSSVATCGPYCARHGAIAYTPQKYVPKVNIAPIRDAWSAR